MGDRGLEPRQGCEFRADNRHAGTVRSATAPGPWRERAGQTWGVQVVLTFADGSNVTVDLPNGVTEDEARAAASVLGAQLQGFAGTGATTLQTGDGSELWSALTKAESAVLTELAHRPDTRSRLALRLGVTTSTLDNHLSGIKRKLLEHLESAGQGPHDGYLSTEMVIGWASRHIQDQKS